MTKKAIITTHDGREATIITKASNVLFEDGQTAQDILNDRQDTMITPIITTSTSMSKVGQGDSVDYSENVVDGAYESCVLKGNTKVNLIQESSSQDVVLPYEFTEGQSVTINDTKESGALGVELKGQTLVNLYPNTEKKQISATSHTGKVQLIHQTEVDKTYLFAFKIEEINLDSNESVKLIVRGDSTEGIYSFTPLEGVAINSNGTFYFKWRYNGVVFKNILVGVSTSQNINSPSMYISNLMLIPYQEGMENWDIPYFEGMQSVQVPSVTTVGKNLLPNPKQAKNGTVNGSSYSVTSDGTFTITGTATGSGGRLSLGTHDVFKLQEGVTYVFAMEKVGGDDSAPHPFFHLSSRVDNISRVAVANSSKTFTYSSKWGGLILGYNVSTGEIYNGTYRLSIVGENENRTYEPYKSTTLTTSEEITLRGIGNVKDTLNTVTGELTQRIGEIVLDGSETMWKAYRSMEGENVYNYVTDTLDSSILKSTRNIVCDKLNARKGATSGIGIYVSSGTICFEVAVENIGTVSDFKTYLQQNPITVQYELATPITKTIPLTFTNQDSQPTTKLSTYNTTTHINASSQEGSLIPTLSHVNPSYPVILKPSTKYSIVADSYSNNHTNSTINFNLGGATASTTVGNRVTTITTPSTLSNELLTMSGRGNKLNNVMVIEGEVVGDEPYFEGMCDVKSYVTLENLAQNSDYIVSGSANHSIVDTGYSYKITVTSQGSKVIRFPIKQVLKPNTPYNVCSKVVSETNIMCGLYYNGTYANLTEMINGKCVFTSSFTNEKCYLVVGNTGTVSEGTELEIYYPIFTEYQEGMENWDIPYFEGTVNIQRPMVKNVGKNLFDATVEPITPDNVNGNNKYSYNKETNTISVTSTSWNGSYCHKIKLQKGETYYVSTDVTWNMDFKIITDDEECLYQNIIIGSNTGDNLFQNKKRSFVAKTETIFLQYNYRTLANIGKIKDIIISSTSFDSYEPYKSNILSCNSEVVLRSLPNGVCDTLDLMTGEYVQRIGEVVLDGSENWLIANTNPSETAVSFYAKKEGVSTPFANYGSQGKTVNNSGFNSEHYLDVLQKRYSERGIGINGSHVGITIQNSRLSTTDATGFKQYLSQNPITVQYELATPITTTIDLQGSPYAYKDGHVQLSSGSIEQSLTPIIEYSVPTNRNGQIRSNQKMVERHQKELDKLQAIILANLINSQYQQTLTTLKYELSRV